MRVERSFFFAAVIVGCIILLPVVGFVLASLWPERVLVSWLLLGLVVLIIIVLLALLVIKTATIAKVRLSEEALRSGRLYANERLIEDEGRFNDAWTARQQRTVMDEPYAERPYVYSPYRQASDPYETNHASSGLKPLSIDSYKWEEEK